MSEDLEPGRSDLLLLVQDTPVDTLAEVLDAQGRRLHPTALSDEAAAANTHAAGAPEISALDRTDDAS